MIKNRLIMKKLYIIFISFTLVFISCDIEEDQGVVEYIISATKPGFDITFSQNDFLGVIPIEESCALDYWSYSFEASSGDIIYCDVQSDCTAVTITAQLLYKGDLIDEDIVTDDYAHALVGATLD